MADNVAITAGSGTTIATDDISGVHYQRIKLVDGALDGTAAIGGDATNGLDVDVTRLPHYLYDTFGHLQVCGQVNDVEVQFHRDDPANLCTVTAAGTPNGTANNTTVPGLMRMSTGTGTAGEIKVVSRDNVVYRAGGEIFCLFTAAWITGGTANCNQRIGLYDTNNGFFIGYEGTSFGVVVRTGGSDGTQTAKANFNVDALTGAAGSKFTRAGTPEAINLALLNVYRIRFGWLGAAPIKFEVLSPDGEWVLFHVIRQPNNAATPSIQSTDIPITAHLVKTSGATDVQFNTACWAAGVTYTDLNMTGSNTLAAAENSVVTWNTLGVSTMRVRLGTSRTGSVIFEGTIDGTNWITHPTCFLMSAAGTADVQVTAAVTPTSGNTYRLQCVGYRAIRLRVSAVMNGTVALHANMDTNVTMVNLTGLPAPLNVVGNGAAATALRVTMANDSTGIVALTTSTASIGKLAANTGVDIGDVDVTSIAAGTNLIGDVDIAPRTTGGWSVFNANTGDTYTALTNAAQVVKGAAGKLGGWYIYNPNTVASYVMIYNIAAASVTVGTSTAAMVLCIPPTSAANLELVAGIPFGTAISCAAATTGGGNTAPTTALEVMLFYK